MGLTRTLTIDKPEILKSKAIKTLMKRFLKRRGRIADVKLVCKTGATKAVFEKFEQLKREAAREFEAGKRIPKYM